LQLLDTRVERRRCARLELREACSEADDRLRARIEQRLELRDSGAERNDAVGREDFTRSGTSLGRVTWPRELGRVTWPRELGRVTWPR
jgi:hypothetical protein